MKSTIDKGITKHLIWISKYLILGIDALSKYVVFRAGYLMITSIRCIEAVVFYECIAVRLFSFIIDLLNLAIKSADLWYTVF